MIHKKKRRIIGIIVLVIYILLTLNTIATERLNKKYGDAVAWNPDRDGYYEWNGNEYVYSTGGCSFFWSSMEFGTQIFHISYKDKKHPYLQIGLQVTEYKWGKAEYRLEIYDEKYDGDYDPEHNFGGTVYVDKNFNPIPMYGEDVDLKTVALMDDLHEELSRLVEIVNERWNLGLSYDYDATEE
jgi:hypothetical protein